MWLHWPLAYLEFLFYNFPIHNNFLVIFLLLISTLFALSSWDILCMISVFWNMLMPAFLSIFIKFFYVYRKECVFCSLWLQCSMYSWTWTTWVWVVQVHLYRFFSKNTQLALCISRFCIHGFNKPQIQNSILNPAGNPWMRGVGYMHCCTPFYIRDISVVLVSQGS